MRWKFNNFTIILVHAHMEDKDKLVKDSCYIKLNQIYQRIPAHDTKIVVGKFNAKTGREDFTQ
jgi:3-methyladenine DNA glycosylase AlkC